MSSYNVILATSGRDTLQRMIDSIAYQLTDKDYLTIIWDTQPRGIAVDSPCTVISIKNAYPLGSWGHGSRTRWQAMLPGDYHLNADDDDIYVPDAMADIRQHCVADKLYVFQMLYCGSPLPLKHELQLGNIGTPCGVYKPYNLPEWPLRHGGDFEFYNELSKYRDIEYIDKIIYRVRG
jgi:hypothetical protein